MLWIKKKKKSIFFLPVNLFIVFELQDGKIKVRILSVPGAPDLLLEKPVLVGSPGKGTASQVFTRCCQKCTGSWAPWAP